MANEPQPTLEDLVAQIRAAQAQEAALEQQRYQAQAQRQALEVQLAARLQNLLGPVLAAEVAAVLAAPPAGSPFAAPPAPPDLGDRGLAPSPTPTPPPAPAPARPTLAVRGVNYYPSRHGWWRMWCDWAPDEIARELDAAQALGVNAVRTFLPFSVVEGRPLAEDTQGLCHVAAATILDRVDQFLTLAGMRGIQTILGLFDEAPLLPALIADPPAALTHIDRVLNYVTGSGMRLGDDPRILMWDLVNELDDEQKVTTDNPPQPLFIHLGFQNGVQYYPNRTSMAWLRLIYRHVLFQSSQQVTFGALNPFTAVYLLQQFPDARHVPQYHEYLPYTGDPSGYFAAIAERMQIIPLRTHRRALIGELGVPSALTRDGITWDETQQAQVTAIILQAAARHADKVLGTLVWALTDWSFAAAAETDEKYRGLLRADLTPKPVADVVRGIYRMA